MSGPSGATFPYTTLPTYNVKNNPSIFNFYNNNVSKLNQLRQYLLAISFNQTFFMTVLDYRNMGRSYYNQNPKIYCSTVKLNQVEGFNGKHITVYLPAPGGRIPNSIKYVKYDFVNRTPLMRVLEPQKLPTCWSNDVIGGTGNCKNISTFPQNAQKKLSKNEQVLYYYIKNADFFTRVLKLLLSSFYNNAVQRFECYTLVFPSDFYAGDKNARTFTVTGDFLRMVYSDYLRASRLPNKLKIPAPRNLDATYEIPTTSYTETELNKMMNDNSNSFNI